MSFRPSTNHAQRNLTSMMVHERAMLFFYGTSTVYTRYDVAALMELKSLSSAIYPKLLCTLSTYWLLGLSRKAQPSMCINQFDANSQPTLLETALHPWLAISVLTSL